MRGYIERRVTSATWGSLPPCKKILKASAFMFTLRSEVSPSCMAFSMYEVVSVACLWSGQFVYAPFLGERRFVKAIYAREKPQNFGTDEVTSAIAEGVSRLGGPTCSPKNFEIQ